MRLADRESRLRSALQLHQRGALEGATAAYRALLAEAPDDADALNLLGVIEGQRANLDGALELISRALRSNPRHALAHTNHAQICLKLARPAEALESARHALRLEPRLLEALHNEAAALEAMGRAPEALESCERALALQPADAVALMRRGYLLLELHQVEAALESFEEAQRLRPRDGEPLRARGRALRELNHFEAALQSYEQALRLNPADGDAHNGHGLVLLSLGFAAAALESYERARQLGVKDAGASAGRAAALTYVGRLEEAVTSWEEALARAPDYPYGPGDLLYVKSQCCDWRDYDVQRSSLQAGVQAGRLVSTPFAFLSACDTPRAQRQCALLHSAARYRQLRTPGPVLPTARRERLTLGYLSADFRDHATARLLAGVIERHDRTAFAVTALSTGRDDGSAMLARLRRAFDHFVDVRERSDREAAELIRGLGIDILIDLNGFAAGGRPAILAQRPAPVQVSYLGYPGTLGAEFIDYLIADQYVVPEVARSHYTEQIAYLPHCYQPNDCTRAIAAPAPSRAEEGLPAAGFVFCCFNAPYKITPPVFELWMRLLKRMSGSVLWLYRDNEAAQASLRRTAASFDVAPERLIFAERREPARHLARHALADLFLDTLPVNAHTTASDALWAGLPVLTCSGESFAGRVAGSLLHAVGLAQLVTHNLREYEDRALELATTPGVLAQIRATLERNRATHPLFDTEAYCRDLESVYRTMWERRWRGEPAATFTIARAAERRTVTLQA